MSKSFAIIDQDILTAALQGLESRKQQLDNQIALVHSLLGNRIYEVANAADMPSGAVNWESGLVNRPKRVLSPEARGRIAIAQKKRWAAFRENRLEMSR